MHIQYLTALSALFLATAVSAQTSSIPPAPTASPTPDMPNNACMECLRNNIKSDSSCSNMSTDPSASNPNVTDPAAKKCLCALASNHSWLTSCQTPLNCSASYVTMLQKTYDSAKDAACNGTSPTGKNGAGYLGPKNGVALVVVVVAANAFLL